MRYPLHAQHNGKTAERFSVCNNARCDAWEFSSQGLLAVFGPPFDVENLPRMVAHAYAPAAKSLRVAEIVDKYGYRVCHYWFAGGAFSFVRNLVKHPKCSTRRVPAQAKMNADDVRAVVLLAEGALGIGSHIDVYYRGQFWESEIVQVSADRFKYRFLHSSQCGWIFRREFISRWRFPVRESGDVWKAFLIADAYGI